MRGSTPWYLVPVQAVWVGVREFWAAEGLSRASSLAYSSLLSLIPLTVVILSVWGLVKDDALQQREFIDDTFGRLLWPEEPLYRVTPRVGAEPPAELFGERAEVELRQSELDALLEGPDAESVTHERIPSSRDEVIEQVASFVENLRGDLKTIGFLGALFLLITTISLFNSIESNLNALWQARERRNPVRKFLVLWALLTLGPLLIAASFVVRARFFDELLQSGFLPSLLPYLFTWFAFFFLYRFVPAARVGLVPAAAAAITAGSLWELGKVVYSHYVAAVTSSDSYTKITYGSLALIPISLVWLYVSWVFALFGAKLAHTLEHLSAYSGSGWTLPRPTMESEEFLAAEIVALIVRRQYAGRKGAKIEEIETELSAPRHRLERVIEVLQDARILAERSEGDELVVVAPPDQLTVDDVAAAVRGPSNPDGLPTRDSTSEELLRLLAEVDVRRRAVLGARDFASLCRIDLDASSSSRPGDDPHGDDVPAPPGDVLPPER